MYGHCAYYNVYLTANNMNATCNQLIKNRIATESPTELFLSLV